MGAAQAGDEAEARRDRGGCSCAKYLVLYQAYLRHLQASIGHSGDFTLLLKAEGRRDIRQEAEKVRSRRAVRGGALAEAPQAPTLCPSPAGP